MRKYKITTNLGLKIIALIFSAFLWMIVVNADNPVRSRTFSDIPVNIVNEDIITSAGDVYQVLGEDTVSVIVHATRKTSQKLAPEDIVATADIAEMDTSTGLVPIKITIPEYEGDYESAEAIPRNIRIQREKSGRKVFALTVETKGTQRDGYVLGDMTVHPENVTITGAQSAIDQIERAVAQVDIDGLSKDTEETASLILYDANGNALNQNQLANNLGEDGLTVSIEVLPRKSVPVVFSASGRPAEGYQYTGCTSEPETLLIYGKEDVLDTVDEIEVPASVIDVKDASGPVELDVDITPYLPEGISLVDENAATIKVTAMVEEEGTRTIDFLVSSIQLNNLDSALQAVYEPDAEITLRFRGEPDALERLDISNAVSVDLSDYTLPGTYDIPVSVNIPDSVTLLSEVHVTLTLEEKEDTLPGETTEDGEDPSQEEDTEGQAS